jgi:putative spermidine/putrescine transport system permease protein
MTDQFLLAAVDYDRDPAGNLERLHATASANQEVFLRTFVISATVTLVCLLIGYPYAMLMAATSGWLRAILLACVLLPLWTSILVRTAAWYVLFQDQGLISSVLQWLGLVEGSFRLLFTRTGVVIAMSHVLLPLMVLPIYAVLLTIPANLLPAAASLGARPFGAFLRVTLPLSASGVASGALLVFMSAIGYYITPALIGGPTDQMVSTLIAFFALNSANWSMAAAFGVLLLAPTLILYFFYSRVTRDPERRA